METEEELLNQDCRTLIKQYFSTPGLTGFDFAANYWCEDYGRPSLRN